MEDTPFPCGNRKPQGSGLSSVSLTADSSLCGGSLLVTLPAKPPLKGEVPAKRAEGFVPHATKVTAALSAAVTIIQQQETAPNLQGESSWNNREPRTPAALREGARGRGKTAIAASGG